MKAGFLGSGLVFLPQYQYEAILCMEVITKFIRQEGLELIEYHDLAIDSSVWDPLLDPGESTIAKVVIKAEMEKSVFEKKLAQIRQLAEHQIHQSKLKHRYSFAMGALSTRIIH